MRYISAPLRRQVIQRAANRCEYCQLAQEGQAATFHIDHVIPIAEEGGTAFENLALACVACSLHKSARLTAIDPVSDEEAAIFNPRQQRWQDHFAWDDVSVLGLTATGRATIAALQMNRPVILTIRAEEKLLQRHPPHT
jgi:D-arabinose 1-dehydrogenase-like Zn-dependent alcohol dehydrogenase